MSEIVAAILGALLGGVLQVVQNYRTEQRHIAAIRVALGCEVDAILRLVNHRGYIGFIDQLIGESAKGNVSNPVIDIRSNYFHIFESLGENIGKLEPSEVLKIVNFYSYCRAAIDSTRPDGPNHLPEEPMENLAALVQLKDILLKIQELGEEIVAETGVSQTNPPAVQ